MRKFISVPALVLLIFLMPLAGTTQRKPLTASEQKIQNRRFVEYAGFEDSADIRDRLKKGVNIEYAIEEGVRALMEAAGQGNLKGVQALLALGAQADARDVFGRTALFYAVEAEENTLPTVMALLDAGSKLDAVDKYGATPLKNALTNKNAEVVAALRQRGAHDDLVEATFRGDIAAIRAGLARGVKGSSPAAYSAAECAVLLQRLEILNLFLAHGVNPNARNRKGQTLLIQAAETGNRAVIEALLATGAEIDAQDNAGNTALMSARAEEYQQLSQLYRLLLDRGAKIDARDRNGATRLIQTARGILPAKAMKILLENGADPNLRDHQGNTAMIHLAWWTQYDLIYGGMEEDHAAAVKVLADRGADVNVRGSGGITALMRAAGWSHPPTLQALLACGAKVDLRDNLGRTALTWAARRGQQNLIVQTLLKAGARIGPAEAMLLADFPKAEDLLAHGGDTAVHGPYGETLLMIAAEKGESGLVQTLLERGADVNARDQQGTTALMLAIGGQALRSALDGHKNLKLSDATEARTQIVTALLARHADFNLRNAEKYTALSIAQEIHNLPITELLTRYGAKTKTLSPVAPSQNGKN